MVATQELPPPTWARGRCRDCEYHNFCRDVPRSARGGEVEKEREMERRIAIGVESQSQAALGAGSR